LGLLEELRSAMNASIVDVVQRLVEARSTEDCTLDYKEVLTVVTDDQKLELARDVSAFANGQGGCLVYGVRERKENGECTGQPEALIGLAGVNPDRLERQLLDILDAHLQPRVQGLTIRIGAFTNGHVVAIGVPRSWGGPHMVKNGTFWVRQGPRKRQYDVTELRSAFAGAGELGARIRGFRDERLGRIISGDTPVPTRETTFVVLHMVPFASIEGGFAADLAWAENHASQLCPDSSQAHNWRPRFNIDGFVNALLSGKDEALEYVQVLRSGAMEYVDAYALSAATTDGCFLETRTLRAIRTLTRALVNQQVPGPFAVLVTLHGVKGRALTDGSNSHPAPWADPRTFDRDIVVLPDVVLREEDLENLNQSLKPVFDALWQAAGWPRSRGYGPDGTFLAARHRDA
jgi:Schlafen, AlbA_2